ncbi:hypothetical protein [Kribbella qitaiheensis]|uniref:hypothetical protein n=1 Tax=Kribbella qitaiheensis TaxID=1544730 RepID=UPI001625E2AC|nr:hypothetical protein [Kribbella qitaiheensis]
MADVLLGDRPFTGQLSHSWPRAADQEPINVGDPGYNPPVSLRTGVAYEGTVTA